MKNKIWITYSHKDDAEGDFSFLVQELKGVGIEAVFDKIALVPGHDLWEQIGDQITNGSYDGWSYLLTSESLASEKCREELAYALNKALNTKGRDFPLIGLVHGIQMANVPPALKVRLCVNLSSPNWKNEIKAALEGRPPKQANEPQTQYIWKIHEAYGGASSLRAVEVRPRFSEIMYWRFAVPTNTAIVQWGYGPSGGGSISGMKSNMVEGGKGNVNDISVTWFGAGDKLSAGISAYVVFKDLLPKCLFFGLASEPFGPPTQLEMYKIE